MLFSKTSPPRKVLSLLGLSLAFLGTASCKSATPPPRPVEIVQIPQLKGDFSMPGSALGALKIQDEAQLIGGPSATGQVGDFLLFNDKISVVVSDIPHTHGVAASGGNIVDVDLARGGHDALGEVFTYLDNTFPRQIIYESLSVTASGSNGDSARISVSGRDSMDSRIYGITHYSLEPFKSQVKIVTEIVNTSTMTIREYDLGDAIQWGHAQAFAPGFGSDLAGQFTQGPWVAGLGEKVSYGWTSMGVTLRGPHGNGWSDVIVAKVDLPPQGRAIFERYLTVGSGDVGSMLPDIFKIRGEISEEVAGSVVEASTGARIEGAVIQASFAKSGRPYATAISDERGIFRLQLTPDEYTLSLHHKSRRAQADTKVDLIHGTPAPQRLTMSAPGLLRFNIQGDSARGLPAKIAIVGQGKTPNPILGPKYQTTSGALNYVFTATGLGEIALPPGQYEFTISRGIEYGIHQEIVDISANSPYTLEATLSREVNTGGYISADLHQSSLFSPDCSVSQEDVLIANLAEGVEVVLGADQNKIPDYGPVLSALGSPVDLKVLSGVTINAPGVGSFTAFPMAPDPTSPNGGAPSFSKDITPSDLMKALKGSAASPRVVQVNHPREGTPLGYFDIHDLDPSTGLVHDPTMSFNFDTLEVFNGKRLKAASEVLRDYFQLLNQGYTFTAVGNSDSRSTVSQERGYPRTYIGVGSDIPSLLTDEEITQALTVARNVIVTNGPFIRLRANNSADIGQLLSAPGGQVALDIQVSAPKWVHIDQIEIVANGEVIRTLEATDPDGIVKLTTQETFLLPQDTWFVVVARGSKGMDPVVPKYKQTTITPLGFTNPIWVDVDDNGTFNPLYPAASTNDANTHSPLMKAATP